MKNEKKIKVLLDQQSKIIYDLIISLNYVINFRKYLDERENNKPKDLWFVFRIMRDNVILNLTKIYNGKETYSFNKLNSILVDLSNEDKQKLEQYFEDLKKGNSLFEKLDILSIRNTHVGHLDSKREKKSIDWDRVGLLIKIASSCHNQIAHIIFKYQNSWFIDRNILNDILIKDFTYFNLVNTIRTIYRNREKNISIEQLDKLMKIKPNL